MNSLGGLEQVRRLANLSDADRPPPEILKRRSPSFWVYVPGQVHGAMKDAQDVNPFRDNLVDNPVHVCGAHPFDRDQELPPAGRRRACRG